MEGSVLTEQDERSSGLRQYCPFCDTRRANLATGYGYGGAGSGRRSCVTAAAAYACLCERTKDVTQLTLYLIITDLIT
jgi:hypothetical protein